MTTAPAETLVPDKPAPTRRFVSPTMKKELTMFLVLVALSIVTAVLNPNFLGSDNLRNNVRHISLISLFALGEAIVIIAGGIDLSIGSVICVAAIATSYLTMVQGLGIGLAVVIALLAAIGIGFAQGALCAYLGLQSFVVTLGFMLALRGVAEVLTGGADIGFQGRFPSFRFLGEGTALGLPVPFWFALGAVVLTTFLMHRTLFGRYCYAIGSNAEAARLSGVPVPGVRVATFVIGAFLSGAAGILYVAYLPTSTPSLGSAYELHAVAAAVLGGCSLQGGRGSVIGVVIGASVMQITFNAVNLVGHSLWQNIVAGSVILAAVIVDRLFEKRAGH